MKSNYLAIVLFFISLNSAYAANNVITTPSLSKIEVSDFWTALPLPSKSVTAIYGVLKNQSLEEDTLLKVESDDGHAELHETQITNNLAQMIHRPDMGLAPGKSLILKPMSFHIMLTQLKDRVRAKGAIVKLKLTFKNAGIISVDAPVKLRHEMLK